MTFDLSTLSADALSELLLDFVKGRASEGQSEAIRLAMKSDDYIAEKVAYYQGLSNALESIKKDATADELGWARLSKAIEQEQAPVAANDNSRIWKYAAAAFAVVAALQTTVLLQGRPVSNEPLYVTASAEAEDPFALNVAFLPSAELADITALLKSVDGKISDGPSAIGLYVIAFASEEARNNALASFQQAGHLIESASLR